MSEDLNASNLGKKDWAFFWTKLPPTSPIEGVSVLVVACRELDHDVRLALTQFVEGQLRDVTPHVQGPDERVTCVLHAQVGREVDEPETCKAGSKL